MAAGFFLLTWNEYAVKEDKVTQCAKYFSGHGNPLLFYVSPAAGFHIVPNLSKSLESFTGNKLNPISVKC